jgi:hypothetical protein
MHNLFAAEQLDIACNNDNQYVCGSQLFPAGHKLDEAVYCSLICSSLVESNLYKANSSTLKKLADIFSVLLWSSWVSSTLHRIALSSLAATRPSRRLLGSVSLSAAYAATKGLGPLRRSAGAHQMLQSGRWLA